MLDYATTEKEKIFKEMRVQSIIGLCAVIAIGVAVIIKRILVYVFGL